MGTARDLAWDVDRVEFRVASVALAVVSAAALIRFQQNEQPLKKVNQRKRDLIAYAVTIGGFGLVAAVFLNARSVISQRIAADPRYPNVKDLPIALVSFAVCTVSRLLLVPLFARIGRALISTAKYGTGAEFEMRAQRFAGQLWKVLFHGTVTLVPLVLLRKEHWWPPGSGETRLIWESYPFVPPVPYLREFYMAQLGYYVHAMMVTLLQRSRPNYIQMVVHHVATIGLVVVSYFLQNNVRFGTLVFWLHDVCDVPVCLTRLVVDLSWIAPTAVCYFWLMGFWMYYRLWVFPVKTVWAVVYTCFDKSWVKREDSYGWNITTPLLLTLIVMHWIWFYELSQMATVYFKTGKREDSTDSHGTPAPTPAAPAESIKKVED